jgi:hypothetical protein
VRNPVVNQQRLKIEVRKGKIFMDYSKINELQEFLGANILTHGCNLYLPKFQGKVVSTTGSGGALPLQYPGGTYSERDAKAALHITSVLGQVLDSDKINLENTSEFTPSFDLFHKTAFLFGSRSNNLTIWATQNLPANKFFKFVFGDRWEIQCENGPTYSLPDPSKLERGEYANQTDYGVISRLTVPESNERLYVIAGLGSRATEGCGYYFSNHWRELFQKYGSNDFAVILKFSPPLDPEKHKSIAWFGDTVN